MSTQADLDSKASLSVSDEFTLAFELPKYLLIENPYPVPVNWNKEELQDAYNRHIKPFEDLASEYAKKNCSIVRVMPKCEFTYHEKRSIICENDLEEYMEYRVRGPFTMEVKIPEIHNKKMRQRKKSCRDPLSKSEKDEVLQMLKDAQDVAPLIYIAKQYNIGVEQRSSRIFLQKPEFYTFGDSYCMNGPELSVKNGTDVLLKQIILKGVKKHIKKCTDDLNKHNFDVLENGETLMVSNFMDWEWFWLDKYFNANQHKTHWNVVHAIPSYKQMESYLQTKMFAERTMRPIASPVRLHNIIITFQKFMSRGYFKDALVKCPEVNSNC